MKFLNFIKRHRFAFCILLIFIILLVVGLIVVKSLFFSNSGDEFGNRLDGIEGHEIKDSDISNLKSELTALENVKNVSENIVGRRADFIIEFTGEVDKATAISVASKLLEYLSDSSKEFYDIQVMLKSENEENVDFPIIGYKNKSQEGFSW